MLQRFGSWHVDEAVDCARKFSGCFRRVLWACRISFSFELARISAGRAWHPIEEATHRETTTSKLLVN